MSRTRRDVLLSGLALGGCAAYPPPPPAPAIPPPGHLEFSGVEDRVGGRIGVAAWNTGTGAWLTYRAHERFAMCSTFKWLLAAQMLYMDMHMPGFRDQRVRYAETDLVAHSPVTRENLSRGWMTVEELCRATVTVSDNAAANLLLEGAMGPEGFTRFLRQHGDSVTRLDRLEPALNENLPGDERDTTTPDAMARDLQGFLLTDHILNPAARERLIGWLVEARPGLSRLRAGLPADWRAGDKTGTSDEIRNATNDVAVAWPPGRPPIVIACYMSESAVPLPQRNAAHAQIARIVATEWA